MYYITFSVGHTNKLKNICPHASQVPSVCDDASVPGGGSAEEGGADDRLLHAGAGRVSPRGLGQALLQGAHGTLHGRQVSTRGQDW